MTCFFLFLIVGMTSVFSQTLPKGLIVKKEFTPGIGLSLGKIVLVQGKALIIHYHDSLVGYEARQGTLLYQKDKLITLNNGRISFQLNDGSQMSMAANATMTINKSVYDPIKGDRKVFMNMPKGKSRFTVRKLQNFRRSAVKIKTTTAIIGVRGSDFIITATEQTTEIVTLDDTVLELNSLFDPSAEAVLIQAYERSEVKSQALPTPPEPVRPEEIDNIIENFSFGPETTSNEKTPESKDMSDNKSSKQKLSEKQTSDNSTSESKSINSKTEESKSDETKVSETKTIETKSAENQTDVQIKPVNNQIIEISQAETPILISDDVIEPPEPVDIELDETFEPEVVEIDDYQNTPNDTIQEIQTDIVEEQTEDEFKSKLPGLPAKPQ